MNDPAITRWLREHSSDENADATAAQVHFLRNKLSMALSASQAEYDDGFSRVFKRLDDLEEMLSSSRYLFGHEITDPDIILADEPTAELDRAHAQEVIDALQGLAGDGVTVVTASHDADVVGALGRVVRMRDGAVVT